MKEFMIRSSIIIFIIISSCIIILYNNFIKVNEILFKPPSNFIPLPEVVVYDTK